MTPERMAELRAATTCASGMVTATALSEALDALEASQAQRAAMRKALERLIEKHPNGHWYSCQARVADAEGAVLDSSDAGTRLLPTELAEMTAQRDDARGLYQTTFRELNEETYKVQESIKQRDDALRSAVALADRVRATENELAAMRKALERKVLLIGAT